MTGPGGESQSTTYLFMAIQFVCQPKTRLIPEFCTQKPSVKFGTQLPKFSGSGNGCPKIQVINIPYGCRRHESLAVKTSSDGLEKKGKTTGKIRWSAAPRKFASF